RRDDAAAGFAADGESDESGGGGGARSGAGAGRPFLEQPGIHGLSAEPDVVERERAERELREQHRAGGIEPADDDGISGRDAILERLRAVRRRDAFGVEEVL